MSGIRRQPRDLAEIMRDEMVMRDRILKLLDNAPRTVPELAEAMGYPAEEVMYWVMAMRRYGLIAETGKPDGDGYFKYTRAKETHT
ncbi:MAG TPA: MarR family transcriptional regulator [Candidatus Hydrogenedentes bacterium]|mgnify:FL=1|nr:MarR family transcriptional regulator [Candidatus Hydrogenedentota bacterium]